MTDLMERVVDEVSLVQLFGGGPVVCLATRPERYLLRVTANESVQVD